MGTLSDQLFVAGLISAGQRDREQLQAESEKRKQQKRMRKQLSAGSEFNSVKRFLEYVRRRLMREYSERLMQEIFTDAHRVADALNLDTIGQKKRARLHALMCRLHDQLPGLGEDERAEVLARECRNY